MPSVIAELLAGKALDVVLGPVQGAIRAFIRGDELERLLVVLHADFGEPAELTRSAFYQWRRDERLRDALQAVLAGTMDEDAAGATVAPLIAPHLLETPERQRPELSREIARGAVLAAPFVIEGASGASTLLLNRLEGGQRRILEAITDRGPVVPGATTLAQALIRGPLDQIGASDAVAKAEQSAADGDHDRAGKALLKVAAQLDDAGLALASENIKERAATHLAAAGDADSAAALLIDVANTRVERGSRLALSALQVLRDLLPEDEQWLADAIDARFNWPEQGDVALARLAAASQASSERADHLRWLAAHLDLLAVRRMHETILEAAQPVAGVPLASGDRLAVQLDVLESMSATGHHAAEEGWLELLRWVDAQGTRVDRGIAWQRRGAQLAQQEQVPLAHDAYRRAMAAWGEIPAYESQVAEAFLSMQAVSLANAKPPPDLELRPLAWGLTGAADTPAASAQRFERAAMASRLRSKLPDALGGYFRAWALHRRTGSLSGTLDTAAPLAELYMHAGMPGDAVRWYIAAGQGKEAAAAAAKLPGAALATFVDVGGPRWERTAAFLAIAASGRMLPRTYVEAVTGTILDEARGSADAFVGPQPAPAAKRALAGIALLVAARDRDRVLTQLKADLWDNFGDIAAECARALMLLTSAGLSDASAEVVERFLDDPWNVGIDLQWLLQQVQEREHVRVKLLEAASTGHVGALEVTVAAGIAEGPQVEAACTAEVERAAELVTVEEKVEGRQHTISVGMGLHLETPAVLARVATAAARQKFVDRLLAILKGPQEPETNRANAATALFNVAPALEVEQAREVFDVLAPFARGRYNQTRWDANHEHPLSRWQISLHVPYALWAAALATLAQLAAKHADLELASVSAAVVSAFDDGPSIVIAAALEATARLPQLSVPVPIEAALLHPEPAVQAAAVEAWAARNQGMPDPMAIDALTRSDDANVRVQLLAIAAERGDSATLMRLAEHDPDAYVRALASNRVATD